MRHGYKGRLNGGHRDYLRFAAPRTVRNIIHRLFEAYMKMSGARFLEQANDAAYADMLARFSEAIGRGLWTPRRNSVQNRLDQLRHDIKEPTS